jgi:xanthine dehydrogenase accessory factor
MWNWITKLEELRAQGRPVVAVTVTQCSGSTPRDTGAKMLVLEDGTFFGTIGGGHLEDLAIADARKCLEEGASRTIKYPLGAKTGQCCGGVVELLMEVVNNGPRLYIFGAGHVGQAACRTLVGTPFSVHVVDERAEWVNSDAIPGEVVRHHCEWDDFVEEARWDADRTYVAIMTHRHDTDQDIIEDVIKRPAKYIGMIGSRGKWERFRQRLTARGVSEETLARVRCPLGIDIGGKAPQEVAVSLAAELLKTHYES